MVIFQFLFWSNWSFFVLFLFGENCKLSNFANSLFFLNTMFPFLVRKLHHFVSSTTHKKAATFHNFFTRYTCNSAWFYNVSAHNLDLLDKVSCNLWDYFNYFTYFFKNKRLFTTNSICHLDFNCLLIICKVDSSKLFGYCKQKHCHAQK